MMVLPPRPARLALAALAAAGLTLLAHWGYKEVRQIRFLYLAEAQEKAGHYSQAVFYARLALQANPRSEKALKLMGKLAAEMGYPWQAVQWYGHRAETYPKNPGALLDFAQTLFRIDQLEAAEKTLGLAAKLPGIDPRRLGMLRAQGAVARGNYPSAVEIYQGLLEQDPGNSLLTYNLANILLIAPSPTDREKGRSLLTGLWERKQMPLEAGRSLVALALKEKNTANAGPWIERLQSDSAATLSDHFLAGEALLARGGPLPPEWSQTLTKRCHTPLEAYAALQWLRKHGLSTEALDWEAALPVALKEAPMVRLGRAEVLAGLGQWERIGRELKTEKWPGSDHFRMAFIRQAYLQGGGTKDSVVDQGYVKQMAAALARLPEDAYRLSDLIRHWNWPEGDREDLLAAVSAQMEISKEKLLALLAEGQRRQDTPALYYFGRSALKLDSTSLVARNNVATYGLLLQKDPDHSRRLAEDLFREHPEIPEVRVTQAFALYRQQRLPEALALMQALPPDTLSQPGTALYYGLILQATGKSAEARTYFQIAEKSTRLLPEERLLAGWPPASGR